ncbi:hypothetical protein [Bacteroides sp. 519]|uniref:hypothetical protein n=1 Tax=Bacteroides sp. 519 TaxID=2302937 RepID=UPI0013D68676|nr:hypothetical protein [Bacteroides sp. 519]NDV56701.1 hypothetical protein [Bacteroides sp. 519]
MKYPSIEEREEKNFRTSSLFYEPKIPQYENLIEIDVDIKKQILWLEQQNVIQVNDEGIRFTHPYHQEVCIYMISNLNDRRRKVLIRNLYNSINCLNPSAAFICSKNIRYLELSDDSLYHAAIDIPIYYLHKPLFPKVRDSILQYFIEREFDMSPEETKELTELIADDSSLYIYWNEETPYYDEYSFLTHEFQQRKLTPEEYIQGISVINRNALISSKLLNQLLLHHRDNEVDFEQNLFEKAIHAEEEFLRTTAIKYLFHFLNKIDNVYIVGLLKDNKQYLLPDTSYKVVELCINNFHKVDESIKVIFKNLIFDIFQQKNNCLRCGRLMLHFTIDYGSVDIHWRDFNEEQQLELWNLWKEVFPIFISNMDPRVASYLMSGRYSRTLMDFAEKVTPEEYITIFESILCFYKLQIESCSFERENQLVALSLAFDITRNVPNARKDIVSDILKLDNKYTTNYLISVCTANWTYLRDDEKERIKERILADDYAAALALFCPNCPIELLHLITRNNSLNLSNIHGVLPTFSQKLLNCSIDVFTTKKILTNYYYDCYAENTFAAKFLLYLFENENERMYDISSALLSNKLMTRELWLKVSLVTQFYNELALALRDLFDLGYLIDHYGEYWLLLFTRFVAEGKSDEFVEYFFYTIFRLKSKFPATSQDEFKKLFPSMIMTYYNTEYYKETIKNISDKVEAKSKMNFES